MKTDKTMSTNQTRPGNPELPSAGAHRGEEALARVQRMIEVAKIMLKEQGYQRMSLNAIIKESGGSKATMRKYFGNKAGLLRSLLGDEANICIAAADAAAQAEHTVDQALCAFSLIVLRFFCDKDSIQISNAIHIEKMNDATVGRDFYAFGYSAFVNALAAHLQRWQVEGAISSIDFQNDAERFLGMLRSGPNERLMYGTADEVSPGQLKSHVRACVSIFLDGIARNER